MLLVKLLTPPEIWVRKSCQALYILVGVFLFEEKTGLFASEMRSQESEWF